jgi:hypothetical protein
MFGRDLIEQVRADSVKEHRDIPIIVEKCIAAVELLGTCPLSNFLFLISHVYLSHGLRRDLSQNRW